FLQSSRRRRCAALSTPLLVLRTSGGLHHLHSSNRICLHNRRDLFWSPHLWVYAARSLSHCHCFHRLRTLGAPYVCHAAAVTRPHLFYRFEHDDCHSQWDSDFLLARNPLDRATTTACATAIRLRICADFRPWGPDRNHARPCGDRSPGTRHLFCRCSLSLCPYRRSCLPTLRRALLLVSEM